MTYTKSSAETRLHEALMHEGKTIEMLQQVLGMNEQQIISGIVALNHGVISRIANALGKSMINQYFHNPENFSFDSNGELGPLNAEQ